METTILDAILGHVGHGVGASWSLSSWHWEEAAAPGQGSDALFCFVKQVAPWVPLTSYSCHLVYMKTDGKGQKKPLWVFPVFIQTAVILTESCLHLKTHYF